jgi:probable phosphoglycerate mutase
MARARTTAELAGWPQAEVVEDLREWDYGELEGLTRAEIEASHPGWLLWRDGCPGGERPDDVVARARRVVARLRAEPGPTLVVAHGHLLRTLATCWVDVALGIGAHLPLDAAATSTLGVDRGTPVLRRWNVPAPHLPQGV